MVIRLQAKCVQEGKRQLDGKRRVPKQDERRHNCCLHWTRFKYNFDIKHALSESRDKAACPEPKHDRLPSEDRASEGRAEGIDELLGKQLDLPQRHKN